MSHWRASLCNKPRDILIDSILLLAIPLAFLPQIVRLNAVPSTSGVSGYYLLYNVILSTTQLSLALTNAAFGQSPRPFIEDIASGRMRGWKAFGAVLGLLQLTMQWLCSMWLLLLYSSGNSAGNPNDYKLVVAATIHAAAILIPTIGITLPRPLNGDIGLGILFTVLNFISIITMPICLVLQFLAQLGDLRVQNGDIDAVSLLSWCLQIPVLAALAFRWACRTGLPPRYPPGPYETLFLWLWDHFFYYYTSSTMAINFAVWALEMYLLVACYLWNNWDGTGVGGI